MQSSLLSASRIAAAAPRRAGGLAVAPARLRKITSKTMKPSQRSSSSISALTPEQGALAASVALLGIANQAMAIGVMKARKRYGVEFPDLYAAPSNPNAKEFNSVQRGHQNTLEQIPIFLAVMAFVALAASPLVAAGIIAVWTAARWVYFSGYATEGPKGRIKGAAVASLTQLISTIVVLVVGVRAAVKLLPL